MSTYLNHGGAEREQILADLWGQIELRVERRQDVTVEHLLPGLRCRDHGWQEDELSLITALSGHAYSRVILAVEEIADHLDEHRYGADAAQLKNLRSAYALLCASRSLAEQVTERHPVVGSVYTAECARCQSALDRPPHNS